MRSNARASSNRWTCAVAALASLGACATTATPASSQPSTAGDGPASRPAADAPASQPAGDRAAPRIEGEMKQRRMTIWGEVKVILKNKHAPLPPLERKPTESKEEPYVTVINDTPHKLTVWLAGPCIEKLEIPSGRQGSTQLCAGAYVVAAKVDTAAFLPLVREDQTFELGIRYTLRIQIKRRPKTIRKQRWVE